MFEYCFWPGDGKNQLNTQGTCFENRDQAKVSALGNTNPFPPRWDSSVHKYVSNLIIKIGGTCRNIQGPGGVVFGEFFQSLIIFFEGQFLTKRNSNAKWRDVGLCCEFYGTSLDRVLQRPLLFCLTYVEKYHTSTIFLVSYFWSVLQLVTRSRPHHGGQRLWPIPSLVPRQRPSRVRRHHPHTMGNDAYARLRCRASVARAGADTPTIIAVPIFFLVAYRTIYRYK